MHVMNQSSQPEVQWPQTAHPTAAGIPLQLNHSWQLQGGDTRARLSAKGGMTSDCRAPCNEAGTATVLSARRWRPEKESRDYV